MTLYDCKSCEKKFGTDECNCKTLCTKDLEEYKKQIIADTIDKFVKHLSYVEEEIVERRDTSMYLKNSERLYGMQMCIENCLGWLKEQN